MKCSSIWSGGSSVSLAEEYPYERALYQRFGPEPSFFRIWSTFYSPYEFASKVSCMGCLACLISVSTGLEGRLPGDVDRVGVLS